MARWRAQSHGQRTKYAVMLDADMSIPAAWRLRLTLQRIAQLCARDGAAALCHQAIKMRAFLEDVKFFTIRVFPTAHIGTQDGWHYIYPVHEVLALAHPSTAPPRERCRVRHHLQTVVRLTHQKCAMQQTNLCRGVHPLSACKITLFIDGVVGWRTDSTEPEAAAHCQRRSHEQADDCGHHHRGRPHHAPCGQGQKCELTHCWDMLEHCLFAPEAWQVFHNTC